MRSSHSRLATTIIAGLFIAAACTSGASPAPAVSTTATPIGPASPRPATTAPPTSPTDSFVVTVAVTVVDSLRVRSQPRVSDDSIKYEPLLPLNTALYVLNGPVSASGYDWYEVAPLASWNLPQGWVASASRDGEPWIADGVFACPSLPSGVAALTSLPLGARLACFSGQPITVPARLIECNCSWDGGGFEPYWFNGAYSADVDPELLLLVEPSETTPPADSSDWLIVRLDPAGRYPEVLPVGDVVEVTGMFDHSAALDCLFQGIPLETAGPPVPTSECRFLYATNSLVVVQP